MALVITVDVYNFGSSGNNLYQKKQQAIMTAQIKEVIPITSGYGPGAGSPNMSFVYSAIIMTNAGPSEDNKRYTAESVAAIVTKINA